MKKNIGFSLIELMVAITISAGLIALITTSFSQQYSAFLFNKKKLEVNQDLRLSMQLIKKDAQNAGVFGNFSFHNQESGVYTSKSEVGASCLSSPWCIFDAQTVGVKSFTTDTDSALGSYAGRLKSGSDILRVQLSGSKIAYLDPQDRQGSSCDSAHNCTINQCNTDSKMYLNKTYFINQGIESTATNYMLTSANKAYLLQLNSQLLTSLNSGELLLDFELSNGCPNIGKVSIPVESGISGTSPYHYIAFQPDMFTMTLSNLITKYYFVLNASGADPAGLYVSSVLPNGTMSVPTLVSASVSSLKLEYATDNNTSFNQATTQTSRYRLCTTSQMSVSGTTNCYLQWKKVTSVRIILVGVGKANSNEQISDTISEVIGWKI